MAIRIFEQANIGMEGKAPVRRAPFSATQSGTVDVTSTASSAFSGSTRIVTIQSDEDCHVLFGASPTATTAGFKITAGETHDFGVEPGSKVAWIAA